MKHRADRLTTLRLAVEADIDPRTAAKVLREGPGALRGRAAEKATEALARLGLAIDTNEPPRAA